MSAAAALEATVVEALGAKVEAPSVEALSEAEELEATVAEKVAAPSEAT